MSKVPLFERGVNGSMLVIPVVKRSVPNIASSSSVPELDEIGTNFRSVPSSYDLSEEFTPYLEFLLTLLLAC